MINLLFQSGDYFTNYGMILIESIILMIVIFLSTRLVTKPLIDRRDNVASKQNTICVLIGLVISLIIAFIVRSVLGYIGWTIIEFFQFFDSLFFSAALMITITFPFHKLFIKIITKGNSFLDSDSNKRLVKRYLFLIGIAWIVFGLFLSIDLLGIQLGEFIPDSPDSPHFDVFLLGFQWAFIAILILSTLTRLILSLIPIDKRPPKDVSQNSILFGSGVAFAIWSIQAFVVEIYLSRLLGITLYPQDIRVLAIVVAIVYVIGFILSMKYYYLPRSTRAEQKLVNEDTQVSDAKTIESTVLDVTGLKTHFFTEEGVVRAVEDVSFKIFEGEVLGLVGETGCGKSVTALSILQLIQSPGKILDGTVEFEGEDLLQKTKAEILNYRGDKITMIFQDPLNSLNPVFTVGKQISETYLLHKRKELLTEAAKSDDLSMYSVARKWSEQLLRDLNIPSPENVIDRYPHELSGGMRQRIQIAMGIACSPKLLIADEPTTALDVTVQNQILRLMKNLKDTYNTAILFITHDLAIISKMCDRVAVMYSGSIVEYGTTQTLFTKPYHPYTKGLLAAIPIEGQEKDLLIIPGMVPNLIYPPSGCRFHPRCPNRFQPCDSVKPKSIEVEPNYFVACHLFDPQFSDDVKEVLK